MHLDAQERGIRGQSYAWILFGSLIALAVFAPVMQAQTEEPKPAPEKPTTYETLYLAHGTTQNDLNDIQTDLRNLLPHARIYGMPLQHAISIKANGEDLALAHKVLAELDRPQRLYRLTYTITDMDGGKSLGTQHYSLVVAAGEKTTLKQGTRVPIVTGAASSSDNSGSSSQVQYVDVGLHIEASLDSAAEGIQLKTKIEQSSLAEEKSGIGLQDPVIRDTTLDGTAVLVLGKAVALGSLESPGDGPGSSRKQEIEVLAELLK
jgi:hypothetical protein